MLPWLVRPLDFAALPIPGWIGTPRLRLDRRSPALPRNEERCAAANGAALVDARQHDDEVGQIKAHVHVADVLETGQRPEARRAIRLDSIDPVNPGRPERVAFSGETEESHRLDRIVTILGEVAGHLLAVRFGVEPLHLVSTNLNDAALRLEVNEAHRYRDAI